jgi:hypothetical protein
MYNENSFYSIDRLVEFGMGLAAARQMVDAMNQTMQTMRVPGAGNSMLPPQTPPRVYYAVLDGRQAGPFSEAEMARLIADKKLSKETYIWHQGLAEWRTAESVPELVRLAALAPPALAAVGGTS